MGRERLTAGGRLRKRRSAGVPSAQRSPAARGAGGGRGYWWLFAACVALVPLAFLAGLLVAEDRLAGVTVDPEPVVVPADTVRLTDESSALLTLRWEPTSPLLAPGWTGLVTDVHMEPGDQLATGDPVVSVDGVVRVAAASEQPLHRRLALGDSGPDVVVLHGLLIELGHLAEPPASPENYSAATSAAVRALEGALGVPHPSGVFDPAWLVWLPAEPWPVVGVAIEAGRPAPQAGEAVATSPETLVGASLTTAEAAPIDLDPEAAWVVGVGGEALPVDPASSALDGDALGVLAGLIPAGTETATGQVRRRDPREVVVVPSSAVVTGEDGRLCVWVPGESALAAVEVEIVGSRAGASHLAPTALSDVLANPAEVLAEPACP